MNNNKRLLLIIALLPLLAVISFATPERVVSTTPVGPIWHIQQNILPLYAGQGAAISAAGKAVLYMKLEETDRTENSMALVDLQTGQKTLLHGPGAPLMPDHATFSPDGRQIVFVLRGPTSGYRSDIYAIGIDGIDLRKLTESVFYGDKPGNPADPNNKEYWVGAAYQRYYYSPRYSPDGSRILLQVHDVVGQIRDFTAVMNPDGSALQILAEGKPAGWSADGKAVYYTHKGLLTRMELETRAARSVSLPPAEKRTPLGRMKGRDWFAFQLGNGRIGWYDFETAAPAPQFLGEWSVPGVKMAGREQLELKGFDWSGSNEVLLWYQGEESERFEVVRIFDPTVLSR